MADLCKFEGNTFCTATYPHFFEITETHTAHEWDSFVRWRWIACVIPILGEDHWPAVLCRARDAVGRSLDLIHLVL